MLGVVVTVVLRLAGAALQELDRRVPRLQRRGEAWMLSLAAS